MTNPDPTVVLPPVTLPELPQGYHLDNFLTLLDYVTHIYPDLLDNTDLRFVQCFQGASREAQSLYVRLLMRKGPVFRQDKLHYPDVPDLSGTLQALAADGLVALDSTTELPLLLNLLRKPELAQLAGEAGMPRGPQRKETLIQRLLETTEPDQLHSLLLDIIHWVVRLQDMTVRRLKLLFFGNSRQDFSEFITTQLGIVRYEDYPIDHAHRFFQSRDRLCWLEQLTDVLQWWDEHGETAGADILNHKLTEVIDIKAQAGDRDTYIADKAARMITRMARQLERLSPEQALAAYRHSRYPPSRERQARILEKQGASGAALQLIQTVESTPAHPDEPQSLQALKKKIQKQLAIAADVTENLPADDRITARQLRLNRSDQLIEIQVAHHLSQQEGNCLALENQLFCGLFGLFFWDIIFSPRPDAFFNPYQLGPKDLWSEHFYSGRQQAVDERLALLNSDDQWQPVLLQHLQEKQGIANYFVNWQVFDQALVERLTAHIPAAHLKQVFRKMLEHPGVYRNGFPDLILLTDNGYHLWEVKGPTDTLQKNQKRWLTFFAEHGIPAGVIHVEWLAT
ncbi:MAG: VRR-NUC domain-containing protein [Ketobacteraceae bacterium]|nr:VRR-NUC domain-containing protein [Ketobacteraceae bacterium]